jgi:hypothetical protein
MKKTISLEIPDNACPPWPLPEQLPVPDFSECGPGINEIEQIKFMSREEAIAEYGLLPIPCTINDIPCEVIMITERGEIMGLPLNHYDETNKIHE